MVFQVPTGDIESAKAMVDALAISSAMQKRDCIDDMAILLV
jgi:hypothetical protein